ncbi:hypothetical protein BaRGS_00036906 [Batillaria attramentaria]|uniref:Uncharacterized protein n=1 Tax=Batillaria attramentaria TaxID=370345 RepID=A0ABD0JAN1_9CAEN
MWSKKLFQSFLLQEYVVSVQSASGRLERIGDSPNLRNAQPSHFKHTISHPPARKHQKSSTNNTDLFLETIQSTDKHGDTVTHFVQERTKQLIGRYANTAETILVDGRNFYSVRKLSSLCLLKEAKRVHVVVNVTRRVAAIVGTFFKCSVLVIETPILQLFKKETANGR